MSWHTLGPWSESGPLAAGVLLTDRLGRVGLQLRDDFPEVVGGGQWSLFGGGVDPGESLIDAALRELAEETSIELTEADLQPFARTMGATGVRVYAFRALREFRPADLSILEGAGFGFLTRAQVETFPCFATSRAIAVHWFDQTGG